MRLDGALESGVVAQPGEWDRLLDAFRVEDRFAARHDELLGSANKILARPAGCRYEMFPESIWLHRHVFQADAQADEKEYLWGTMLVVLMIVRYSLSYSLRVVLDASAANYACYGFRGSASFENRGRETIADGLFSTIMLRGDNLTNQL